MKKLGNFRSKYKNERCFIVGNGASLNKTPLDLLSGDVSFGMNMISLIFDRTPWRPDYIVVTTTALGDQRYQDLIMAGVNEAGRYSFIWDAFKDDPMVGAAPVTTSNIVFIPVIHSEHIDSGRCSRGPGM
jgi:hypothetical protein